ncbi:MAG: SRPBCC family protein [Gammaproteobacteria bacterium]|nr:SRPBCC family protein [Gammaproteobacteria bacterium]
MIVFAKRITPLLLLLSAPALGAGQLEARQDTTINAPGEEIWDVLGDFCSIAAWHPAVVYCTQKGNTQPDAMRTLTLGNGEQLHERLLEHDNAAMQYRYSIPEPNLNALPVTDYESSVLVEELGNGKTRVVWEGSFNAGGETGDEDAVSAIDGVYQGGLAMLKEMIEGLK